MKLFISLDSPHQWIILNRKNQVKDTGIASDLESYLIPKSVEQVIGVAQGGAIACHSVGIPGKRRHHIESALPYALEDRLTEDVENLHFKLLSWQAADNLVYAAVVSKKQLSDWIVRFQQFGINLDAIIPDYLLLPQPPNAGITISKLTHEQYCVRLGTYQGLFLDNDGFTYWWQIQAANRSLFSVTDLDLAKQLAQECDQSEAGNDQSGGATISHWDIGNNFTQWLANSQFKSDIDSLSILDGNFLPTHNRKFGNLMKLAMTISVIGFVMYFGSLVFEFKEMESRRLETNTELRGLFTQHFPDEPYLDRPRAQLTSLIDNGRAGKVKNIEFQFYMNAVSKITPGLNAVIEEINFRENEMIVLCTVTDLSSLDTIMQAFNELGSIDAILMSSGARDGKITGRFQLSKRV